ncbi:hypothetical protein KIW84_012947 [Lathyrus oleraceus]|uniref:Uncharacterized protein n=1 Tax=Pisum sativum TaxID=3888 RepID=A0A9D5BJA8_PEA|nr:hypothetical protein KIW84_012947 [Pisum sativum]
MGMKYRDLAFKKSLSAIISYVKIAYRPVLFLSWKLRQEKSLLIHLFANLLVGYPHSVTRIGIWSSYHPAVPHNSRRMNGERGKREAGLEERVVQARTRGYINSLKAFGVMNRKPFRKKYIIKRLGLVARTDDNKGYRADAASYRKPQGCKVPEKRPSLCL